jgi:adenylylsulfate kinase
MPNKAVLIWFTGLSGAGKSTLSSAVNDRLQRDSINTAVLDGDKLRKGLCKDLGFTAADRTENIRRAGEVAKLFVDSGLVTLAAFMSPMEKDRTYVRTLIGADRFVEIYCKCAFEVCEARDVKGLYKKARTGELKNFVGLDEPYEEPVDPALEINTATLSIEASVDLIMNLLRSKLIVNESL